MAIQDLNDVVFTVDKKEQNQGERQNTLRRIYQQGKQLSQIVSYIWRWIDSDDLQKKQIAKKLNDYFANPTEEIKEPGGRLKELLGAHPEDCSEEAKLLKAVFFEDNSSNNRQLLFPIFNEFELGDEHLGLGYLFEVDFTSFKGTISDGDKNLPQLLELKIPYPPRPQLGEATVTLNELEKWIENRTPDQYFPENSYIPATSS